MSIFVVINEIINGYGMFTILIKSQNLTSKTEYCKFLNCFDWPNAEAVRFFYKFQTLFFFFFVQDNIVLWLTKTLNCIRLFRKSKPQINVVVIKNRFKKRKNRVLKACFRAGFGSLASHFFRTRTKKRLSAISWCRLSVEQNNRIDSCYLFQPFEL